MHFSMYPRARPSITPGVTEINGAGSQAGRTLSLMGRPGLYEQFSSKAARKVCYNRENVMLWKYGAGRD